MIIRSSASVQSTQPFILRNSERVSRQYLKTQTQSQLSDSCIHRRAADDAKRWGSKVGIWTCKLWMVDRVHA